MDQDETYLWITVEPGADETVIAARGELDAASAPELRQAIADAATAPGIALDLSEVDFIDSSGLRVVAEAVRVAKEEDRRLRIAAMSDAVRRVFDLSGLTARLGL